MDTARKNFEILDPRIGNAITNVVRDDAPWISIPAWPSFLPQIGGWYPVINNQLDILLATVLWNDI